MSIIDNYDLFEEHENEQYAKMQAKPKCNYCGEPIQDEYRYNIGGDYYCEKCIEDMRESNDDFE